VNSPPINARARRQTGRRARRNLIEPQGYAHPACAQVEPGASRYQDAITYYEAPSTIAIAPGPKITAEQTLFGFAHQISLKPRETSWRWDAPASQPNPSQTQN